MWGIPPNVKMYSVSTLHVTNFLWQVDAEKLQQALDKLNDVDHTIDKLEKQLATLQPQLAKAEQDVQHKMGLITAAKERLVH